MTPTYVFQNPASGETRFINRRSLNRAAAALGLESAGRKPPNEQPTFRDGMQEWRPWECWEGATPLWHLAENGETVPGGRPDAIPPMVAQARRIDAASVPSRQMAAARAMLAALHQDLNQFDTLHRLGILTASQAIDCERFARAAIAQAEAAGIKAEA